MKVEPLQLMPEQFTPHHLLRLVEAVKDIGNKEFTQEVAVSLRMINQPPLIVSNVSKDS